MTEPAPPSPIPQPIPHWPGRLVSLASGKRVWLAGTRAHPSPETSDRELVLCVHGMTGDATNWTDFMAELKVKADRFVERRAAAAERAAARA